MTSRITWRSFWFLFILVIACNSAPGQQTDEQAKAAAGKVGDLVFTSSVVRDDLNSVVSIDISADGTTALAASYNTASVSVYQRDATTGALEHLQTISDPDRLDGVTSFRVSPNGRYAVSAAFRSETVVLFERDLETGRVKVLDSAREGDGRAQGLVWAIDAIFSRDSRFVYAIADNSAAVTTFRVTRDAKLEFVAADFGKEDCFQGARGIASSPDGQFLYVASNDANTLVVLNRDPMSGQTTIKQILRDEEDAVHGLGGVFSVACSPDGKFIYTSAGRFQGDNAVCVFKKHDDGTLSLVEELHSDDDRLAGFEGGNEIVVTPDGLSVYVCGSQSHSLVGLRRDPTNGKLSKLRTLFSNRNGVGPLGGVSGIGVSPDNKFIYTAAESDAAVAVFLRSISEK